VNFDYNLKDESGASAAGDADSQLRINNRSASLLDESGILWDRLGVAAGPP
jgi:hypothetical protein